MGTAPRGRGRREVTVGDSRIGTVLLSGARLHDSRNKEQRTKTCDCHSGGAVKYYFTLEPIFHTWCWFDAPKFLI